MGIVWQASADIRDLSVWSAYGNAEISNTTARTGTYSYKLINAYAQRAVTARADYYVKFGIYINAADSDHNFIEFREGTIAHVSLDFNTNSGTIKAYRGAEVGTLLGASSGFTLNTATWYCAEIYVNVHDSTGTVTVKIDGSTVLNLTGIDTRNGGTGVIDNIRFWSTWVSSTMYIDDVAIRDDAWPGTGGLYLLTADGDGSDTGWTASAGNRWSCVDEVPPSATDYISTAGGTPNTKNTFTFTNLGITPDSIASVSVLAKAKLAKAGTGNIRAIAKSGSTYGNGASTALGTTESWVALHTTVDPDTSSAWDLTGVNALSAGVETV